MFTTKWMEISDIPRVMAMSIAIMQKNPKKTVATIQRPDHFCVLMLENKGETAGYMLYRHSGDTLKIKHICVIPEYRRAGGATNLIQFILTAYAKTDKPKPVEVVLREDDEPGQALFRSLKFKASGIKKAATPNGRDGYVFRFNFDKKVKEMS